MWLWKILIPRRMSALIPKNNPVMNNPFESATPGLFWEMIGPIDPINRQIYAIPKPEK